GGDVPAHHHDVAAACRERLRRRRADPGRPTCDQHPRARPDHVLSRTTEPVTTSVIVSARGTASDFVSGVAVTHTVIHGPHVNAPQASPVSGASASTG